MFEVGINTNNECGENFSEIIENIKDAGFENVMVAFIADNKKNENFIIETKKLGFNIPFVHLYSKQTNSFWSKGEKNKALVKNIIEQIELCAKYKIPVAVLHATLGDPEIMALPPSSFALECMNNILRTAKQCNVKIALENLDSLSKEHFTYFLNNISSPNLGLCYDAGHHNLYFPDFDILSKYGDKLWAIHLHDNLMDWQYGHDYSRDLHLLPFDGKIDYEAICKKIAQTNYNGVVMLEVHKQTCSEPKKYKDLDNKNYLSLAKQSAEKLAEIIKNFKEQL